jgi:hypothetical protein
MAVAYHLHRDRLSPANICRYDADLHVPWIEAGRDQLGANAVSHDGVIFTALPGDPRSNRSRRLLSHPDVNQASEFDDAEEDRQQDERNRQHGLKRFLPTLPLLAAPGHDVWVSR